MLNPKAMYFDFPETPNFVHMKNCYALKPFETP